jgi:peptidoglycan/xylan/chitin deacetylase (PgdA/CDA1 family)
MYLHYIPAIVQWLFPQFTWHKSRKEKYLYLSFDDGPVPEVTPFVLDQLQQYGAKATFFCVGENMERYPHLLERLLLEGHSIGNHTHRHLNGRKTKAAEYCKDVQYCRERLQEAGAASRLFRPPYGRIRKAQARQLLANHEIVMWDVLSADYDPRISPEKCLQKSIRYTRNGSIIVFHDSIKAWPKLAWVLPRYLEHFTASGYTFKSL